LVGRKLAALAMLPVACLAASAPAVAQPVANAFPARIIAAHNIERARMGMPPLTWDAALAAGAAVYAQQMAMSGQFAHSDRSKRRGVGENLWMGTRGAFSFEAMVGGWTSERKDFVPGVFPAVSRAGSWEKVGHYTQIVWPTTTRVGCAIASNSTNDYLVCRYSPAGNVMGRPLLTTAYAPQPHAR
jgi:hypothetical protein